MLSWYSSCYASITRTCLTHERYPRMGRRWMVLLLILIQQSTTERFPKQNNANCFCFLWTRIVHVTGPLIQSIDWITHFTSNDDAQHKRNARVISRLWNHSTLAWRTARLHQNLQTCKHSMDSFGAVPCCCLTRHLYKHTGMYTPEAQPRSLCGRVRQSWIGLLLIPAKKN